MRSSKKGFKLRVLLLQLKWNEKPPQIPAGASKPKNDCYYGLNRDCNYIGLLSVIISILLIVHNTRSWVMSGTPSYPYIPPCTLLNKFLK